MDVLHACLLLGWILLMLTMLGGYHYLLRQDGEEWMALLAKVPEPLAEVTELGDRLEELKADSATDSEELIRLRAELTEARRVLDRAMLREADQRRQFTALGEFRWCVWSTAILSTSLLLFGLFRWKCASQGKVPA